MKRKKINNKAIKGSEDIKLAYLHIFDAYPQLSFCEKDLNFGSSSIFQLISLDNVSYELLENPNNDYLESFFEDNLNVSCIVGMNGSGKTTLLKILQFIINQDTISDLSHGVIEKSFSYLAVFQIGNNFYYRLNNTEEKTILKNGTPITNTFDEFQVEQTSIFYSGYTDLGFEYNFDEPGYIDVSTGFLIHKKYDRKDEEDDEKQVTYFNREDIKMQITFLAHIETEKQKKKDFSFIDRFIPSLGEVACYAYISKFDSDARYIDMNSLYLVNSFT